MDHGASSVRPSLVRFGPERRVAGHVHPAWSVAVPVQGVLYEHRKHTRLGACAGEALTIAPDAWHENGAGSRGCLHLLLEITDEADLTVEGRLEPGIRRLPERCSRDVRELVLTLESDDPAALLVDQIARSLVVDLAGMGRGARTGPPPAWLQTARERVLDDPRDPPDLVELAGIAGLHPSSVLRAFRSAYGATPAGMARRRRLEEAARLLESTSEEVGRIALRLGFSDHSHLTRTFRNAFGVTPTAYRRTRRGYVHPRPSYRRPGDSD